MGTIDDSVNCPKGSQDLFRRFQGCETTIVIESSEAAKCRPTKDFFQWCPRALIDEMILVGFRLALCRCDPTAVYAEGLINANVGRGANYTTNINMSMAILGNHETECSLGDPEIEKYVSSLVNKRDPENTSRLLHIMYHNLDKIFGFRVPVITGPDFEEFLQSEDGQKAFEKFSVVALEHPEILNPMYDYYAACVLLNKLKTN
jgi:hypothetical protein